MTRQILMATISFTAFALVIAAAPGRPSHTLVCTDAVPASPQAQVAVEPSPPKKIEKSLDELLTAIYSRYSEQDVLTLVEKVDLNVLLEDPAAAIAVPQAVYKSLPRVCVALVERGASPNSKDSDGRTALMYAARNGDLGLCRWLISHGADRESKDLPGWTAADFAASWGHLEVAYVLRDPNADGSPLNMRYVSLLASAAARGDIEIMNFALGEGVDVNLKDEWGLTPLLQGLRGRSPDAISCLLAAGADPDRPGADGATAREAASKVLEAYRGQTDLTLLERLGQTAAQMLASAPAIKADEGKDPPVPKQ